MKTYYTYDKLTRKPTGEVRAKEKPKYSTEWKPLDDCYFFDGYGWVLLEDSGLSRDEKLEILLSREEVKEEYSAAETSTFFLQLQEAQRVLDGDTSNLLYLEAAVTENESIEDLALKIVDKHEKSVVKVAQQRKARKELQQRLEPLTDEQLEILVLSPQLLPVIT